MNVVHLFSLGAAADAKDYLRNFNHLEAKSRETFLPRA